MPDEHIDDTREVNPSEITHRSKSHENSSNHLESEDRIAEFSSNLLDQGDSIIYAVVGVCFFLGAIFALCYSFWHFADAVFPIGALTPTKSAAAIIQLISDLLLVLIIMEVIGTVIHYLKAHATSLRPFLFIGIVSATRGILSIGARLSVEGNIAQPEFTRAMIVGINAAVILALGITLKLIGSFLEEKQD